MENKEVKKAVKYFKQLRLQNWAYKNYLARGGQGTALLVTNPNTEEEAVFKQSNIRDGAKGDEDKERFRRELAIITEPRYKHPNIVNILEFPNDPDQFWYISEKGKDFGKYWKKETKKLSSQPEELVVKAIEIIRALLKGLAPLHTEGIVHRDIKAKNIVVVNNEPVLIDFGITFEIEDLRITPSDGAVGNRSNAHDSMAYPMRNEEILPWLDIFSISQLLMWMLRKIPVKDWTRTLHWRFVPYPSNFSSEHLLAIRGLTGVCSEPEISPQNATEMLDLIDRLFTFPTQEEPNQFSLKMISQQIKENEAKKLIDATKNIELFTSSFLLVEKFFNDLALLIKPICKKNKEVEIKFEDTEILYSMIDRIQKSDNAYALDGFDFNPYNIVCLSNGNRIFDIEFRCRFNINCISKKLIPFVISITAHSTKNPFAWEVTLNNTGEILTDGSETSPKGLFDEIEQIIFDQDNWAD